MTSQLSQPSSSSSARDAGRNGATPNRCAQYGRCENRPARDIDRAARYSPPSHGSLLILEPFELFDFFASSFLGAAAPGGGGGCAIAGAGAPGATLFSASSGGGGSGSPAGAPAGSIPCGFGCSSGALRLPPPHATRPITSIASTPDLRMAGM